MAFSKKPFLPAKASKAVKTLIAKSADEVQKDHFGNEALNGLTGLRESKWLFQKSRFCPQRPVRPLRPSSPKGPMRSKTSNLKMKRLTALLCCGSQNGFFPKKPFLPAQASKAVKTLIAKRADEVQNVQF